MTYTYRTGNPFGIAPFQVAAMPAFGLTGQIISLNADRSILDVSAAAASERVRVVTESTDR